MGFIWSIIIGIVAGYLAGKIMRGGGFGVIVNLILGIIGGVLGGWVFSLLGISAGGILGSLIPLRSELFCYYGSARYSTNPKRFKKACSIIKSYITWQQNLTKL